MSLAGLGVGGGQAQLQQVQGELISSAYLGNKNGRTSGRTDIRHWSMKKENKGIGEQGEKKRTCCRMKERRKKVEEEG
jgi:hypothetical protein